MLRKRLRLVLITRYHLIIEAVLLLGTFGTTILILYDTNADYYYNRGFYSRSGYALRGNALGIILLFLL